ncbi:MAG: hypothetical protein HOC70_11355 [Gammaproteobacteria bacterium]|jgi:TAG lipase / steryl ester hydrolase / phospholipase A2 / LPA acyltransferase|nr:hypothetical protein [Gammaproteobacteria bacterium]MBT4493830.1 hypothetical protein [Gammaproteobacteria bacterium]MBT7370543.1 hypothetical protein [Gammaproteobacteria bacterium]
MKEGDRATWTKLEQIRICSKIGQTLDHILDQHSEHDVTTTYKSSA